MKTFLWLVVALFISIARPHLVGADTYPRQPNVDALHYAFQLTLNDDNDEIIGEATITLRFTGAGVAEVVLDLASTANGKGMTVGAVTEKGAPVAFKHQTDRLVLTLATAPATGDERKFTVRYRGVPANGLRMLKNKFGERVFFS